MTKIVRIFNLNIDLGEDMFLNVAVWKHDPHKAEIRITGMGWNAAGDFYIGTMTKQHACDAIQVCTDALEQPGERKEIPLDGDWDLFFERPIGSDPQQLAWELTTDNRTAFGIDVTPDQITQLRLIFQNLHDHLLKNYLDGNNE